MEYKESPRRAALYVRVSTTEQKLSGYSPDMQRKKLLEYVNNNPALNFTTKEKWIFEDSHTGSDLNRTELQKMMKLVESKEVDAVIVWKIDRFSRSLKHLLYLFEKMEKNNVSFVSIQENLDFRGPVGKLIFNVFGAIAEFERELIKGRTTMGKEASALQGNYTGPHVPYGYKKIKNKDRTDIAGDRGSRLYVIEEEKKWVQQIFEWYIWDGMGDLKIAKKLNDLNVSLGKGNMRELSDKAKWTESRIAKIITDPIYHGSFVAKDKDEFGNKLSIEDQIIVSFPACVSKSIFLQAREMRSERTGGGGINVYLLSRKLRDVSISPSRGFVGAGRSKGGFSYRRPAFTRNGIRYKSFEFPAKQLEEMVWSKLLVALKNPEKFIRNYIAIENSPNIRKEILEKELEQNEIEIEKLKLEVENVLTSNERGRCSDERCDRRVQEIEKAIVIKSQKNIDLEREVTSLGLQGKEISNLKEASKEFKFRLDNISRVQKRTLCNMFIKVIKINRTIVEGTKKEFALGADIYLKFNPDHYLLSKEEVCTQKAHQDNDSDVLGSKLEGNGRPGES